MKGDPPVPCKAGMIQESAPHRIWLPDWRDWPHPRQPIVQIPKAPK